MDAGNVQRQVEGGYMRRVQQIRLKNRPSGTPSVADFLCADGFLPDPEKGQALIETLYISLDPYLRLKLSRRHISGNIEPGEVMSSEIVGRVIESHIAGLEPGDLIRAHAPWQGRCVLEAADIKPLGFNGLPPSLALGILGMPGLTAYAGVNRLCQIKEGAVFVVSAAAGPVGSLAGQLAREKGAKVIGIAGGAAKCGWVRDGAGFDACIDYKGEDVRAALKRHAPNGVDIYFDNVGGDILSTALEHLALNGQIILCGLMSQVNSMTPAPGLNLALIIRHRATLRGLIVYDHEDLRDKMIAELSPRIRSGQIAYREDVSNGLSSAPQAFARLMRGENFGKTLVRLA